ncbi:MAG: glycerol kinase GlpK [Coxiellaceae bacterium]|nr:glycerol kinase GlpK [Coxiellaceae bacterium]
MTYLIAIDQGTTSTRAIVFNRAGQSLANHQIELHQFFPHEGWVEHNADEIWQSTVHCVQQAIDKAKLTAADIAAIGISNQRETTVLWDKETGKPIYHAIVWQDRRTAAMCQRFKSQKGVEEMVSEKTGLLLDPYFSATKIAWMLGHVEGARAAAEKGQLLFGTIESYLLWRLTGGKKHLTDATNASRTLLFNIHSQQWDKELLELFDIPPQLLPEVVDNVGQFGESLPELFGESIAITGMAGDQQAATVGQACFQSGMLKSTYGTGCFMLLNTGDKVVTSRSRLLSTVAYRIDGQVTYGLEGSIFVAGAAIQWLRDNMGMVKHAADSEFICQEVSDCGGVYMVPAFTGMGAPYWDPEARAAIMGMTRDTGIKHIVRAAVESVCYQSKDLLQAMLNDGADVPNTIRVDGGMVSNNWMLQFLADLLVTRVDRPSCIETSALGAAYLAGLGAGVYQNLDELSQLWQLDCEFAPEASREPYELAYQGWLKAVGRVVGQHDVEISQQPATLTE